MSFHSIFFFCCCYRQWEQGGHSEGAGLPLPPQPAQEGALSPSKLITPWAGDLWQGLGAAGVGTHGGANPSSLGCSCRATGRDKPGWVEPPRPRVPRPGLPGTGDRAGLAPAVSPGCPRGATAPKPPAEHPRHRDRDVAPDSPPGHAAPARSVAHPGILLRPLIRSPARTGGHCTDQGC